MRGVTSRPALGDVMTYLYQSPITSQYAVEGKTSLGMAMRRLSNVDSSTAIPGVTGA